MLLSHYHNGLIEAGCDEAGRGCLAGDVYAAAVVLPADYRHPLLDDSKKLTARQRYALREDIVRDALAWGIGICTAREIERINILRASILAMHRALDKIEVRPQAVIIDGNRFDTYRGLPCQTIVKGDGKYLSIAAASILAKTFRDDYMLQMDAHYPQYDWKTNKGYPTARHREAIAKYGVAPLHRRTFRLT